MKIQESDQPFKLDMTSNLCPLEQIRGYLGITRRQLANKLGVDYETILNWEIGKRTPTFTWEQIQAMELVLMDVGMRFCDIPRLGPEKKKNNKQKCEV